MEPNSSQVEFDIVKGLKVDEKWISFHRRKGNKEWSYAEAMTGNIVHGGKNITSGQNQFNTSSNLRDNATVEVSSRVENKVEENLFTIDDKWVSNKRNRWKCKKSNIEGMKLNGTGTLEYGDEDSGMVRNNVGNFNSSLNLNFSSIISNLLKEEQRNSYRISTTLPERCANISVSSNFSQSVCLEIGKDMLDSQDQELLSILEESQIFDHNLPLERSVKISATRITGYFCSNIVLNLINRVLTDIDIKVLEKGLDFAPIQRKINGPESKQDFADFRRRMRTK